MEHRTIEIDFEVHKRIEAERTGFSESANDVLRRLLGIGGDAPAKASAAPSNGRPWTGKGVALPSGTQLRMDYNGRAIAGVVEDGEWLVEGRRFSSPSAAAGELCRTRAGKKTSIDGWKYWQAKRPGDDSWIAISTLRPEHARMLADITKIDI